MNYAHSIPEELEDLVQADLPPRSTTAPDAGFPSEPSHAERARTLVHACAQGFLSTICREPKGFPFGSVVKHAVKTDGHVLLCLSDLAEHSKNLKNDPKASLMAVELVTGEDPLAAGRVTLIGPLHRLTGQDEKKATADYLDVHPGAYFAEFDDFHMYLLEVTGIRYVGGFGKMSWVRTEDFLAASPDPLRAHSSQIIDHMNEDHTDALVTFSRTFGSLPDATGARMTAVDRYGFDLLATSAEGQQALRLGFGRPLSTTDDVRARMIEMLSEARELESYVGSRALS